MSLRLGRAQSARIIATMIACATSAILLLLLLLPPQTPIARLAATSRQAPLLTSATSSSSPVPWYDPAPAHFYAYAPAVLANSSDGIGQQWTCHNSTANVFHDAIWSTTYSSSGAMLTDAETFHTGASGTWDSSNVCDPAILQGSFKYGATMYSYALFFTGNNRADANGNQIGVAFATSLAGPWISYPSPVITYSGSAWGAGQPSATSVSVNTQNGTDELLLFYTYNDGTSGSVGRRADLVWSNSSGSFSVSSDSALPTAGLLDLGGSPTSALANMDVAYNPADNDFYTAMDAWPLPSDAPDYLAVAVQVYRISAHDVWTGDSSADGGWVLLATLDSSLTGAPRNHNAGLLETGYGQIPAGTTALTVLLTTAPAPWCVGSRVEWCYTLYETSVSLT